MTGGLIFAVAIGYLLILFAIAHWGDRQARLTGGENPRPFIYALSLGVYCTSWTFYGSVGVAAHDGANFLAIYIGPILVFLIAPFAMERFHTDTLVSELAAAAVSH